MDLVAARNPASEDKSTRSDVDVNRRWGCGWSVAQTEELRAYEYLGNE